MAPTSVSLRVDGQESPAANSISVSIKEGEENSVDVACVAREARPKPTFKWFIGETEIQV